MRCPDCGGLKIRSRGWPGELREKIRSNKCQDCGMRYMTREVIMPDAAFKWPPTDREFDEAWNAFQKTRYHRERDTAKANGLTRKEFCLRRAAAAKVKRDARKARESAALARVGK